MKTKIISKILSVKQAFHRFVRFRDGSFSAPIVDPNDTVGFTEGRGINNRRTVVGDYGTSDGNLHGFFLSGGTFTGFDIPGAAFTAVLSINNPGDFTGTFIFPPVKTEIQQAFVSVGGTITSFSIPAAIATLAYDITDSKRLVVGYYIDASGILHGYTGMPMGRCTSRSIPRAPLGRSCLEITIGTGWWADMRTPQA